MKSYYSFLDHIKISLSLSLALGSLLGLLVLVGMPFFLDNVLDLIIFCLLVPLILGCLAASVFFLLQQMISPVNHSIHRLRLPFTYMISFLLFIITAFLSGWIYLFVSTNLVIHLFLILIYLSVWFLMLSKMVQPKLRLSSGHLALTAVCLFLFSLALYIYLTPFRNFKIPARVFIVGVDAATWSVINPLIEKGRLPYIAELKEEGSYGTLKSIEPMLSPILWTTIATGKVEDKHGVEDFYSTQESIRTMRIWDMFEAQGMKIGIFKWLVTWPPREVNGFVIPDILARDDRTFPPEYSAVNSLRIAEKSRYSLDIPTYVKLTWSLVNMGLRMSTLREIGWNFFLEWFRGANSMSQYPLKRKAELLINEDVFIYLLKKYEPEFVTFYDNGVDTLSHRYWKYYEPKYFPGVSPEEVRRYGDVIPNYYQLVDRTLGSLMRHFSDDTLIVVVSDHGQQAANKTEDARYYPKLSNLLHLMDLDSVAYGIALGSRSLVRLKNISQTEFFDKIQKQFEEIKVVETGKVLFDVIPRKANLLVKMRGEVVDFRYHIRIDQKDLKMEDIVYKKPPLSGVHDIKGIMIMKGPNIHSGLKISGADILDITPTILYLEKMPISKEVDGSILFSAISESFQKANSARFASDAEFDKIAPYRSMEFDKQVEERLKSLGYIQ